MALVARQQPKYTMIAERIRRAISDGSVRCDELLPSQNDLMQQFGVSITTVRKVIDLLIEDGWIRAERGRGLFAQLPAQRAVVGSTGSMAVGCAMIGSFPKSDRFSQILLSGAVSVLEPAGHEIRYASIPVNDNLMARLAEFKAGLFGLLVCGEIRDDVLRALKESQTRAVIIGHTNEPNLLLEEFHRVLYDTDMAGYLAAQALAMQGHKRVAFAYTADHDRAREIREGFIRGCRDHGMQPVDVRVDLGDDTGSRMAKKLAEAEGVTGVALQGEPTAVELAIALRDKPSKSVAERSIVVITGLPAEDYPDVALNRVEFNIKAWGQEAAKLLLTHSSAVVHKRIPVRFKPAVNAGGE
jgi:GntR family transcriptional regulator of arabinose operon